MGDSPGPALRQAIYPALARTIIDAWPGLAVLARDVGGTLHLEYHNRAARTQLRLNDTHGAPLPPTLLALVSSGALRRVHLGRTPGDDADLILVVPPERPTTTPTALSTWRLSRRQAEVLAAVIRGDTNKGIAAHLGVSVSMVEQHLAVVFKKAGVTSRHELIAVWWSLQSR
jgi:DNA-binding CsgD family transcriptional regulator